MLINICNPGKGRFDTWSFAPKVGHSWRTDGDIGTTGGGVPWARVMRNLDSNNRHPEVAGPGAWNDPDYLGPELGMTSDESRAQFLMWATVAAPLIIGSDVRKLSDETIELLTNEEVIQASQDPAGVQGTLVRGAQSQTQVWVRPLANGDRAVTLLNRSSSAATITTTAAEVGLSNGQSYALRDVMRHRTTLSAGRISASVAAHAAVMFRVSVQRDYDPAIPPATYAHPPAAVTFPSGLTTLEPGRANTVRSTFTNDGQVAVSDVRLTLASPPGWQVEPATVQQPALAPGESVEVSWQVRPPEGSSGSATLRVDGQFRWGSDQRATVSSAEVPVEVVHLVPPAGSSFLSDLNWVRATSGFDTVRKDRTYFGTLLQLDGRSYDKGLWLNAEGSVDYYLAGKCDRLTADLGIDDSARGSGSVVYEVWADFERVFVSEVISRESPTQRLDVDISGAEVLWLHVTDAGDGIRFDNADFAAARIECEA